MALALRKALPVLEGASRRELIAALAAFGFAFAILAAILLLVTRAFTWPEARSLASLVRGNAPPGAQGSTT